MHLADPSTAENPGGHAKHVKAPDSGANWPALHGLHSTAPQLVEMVPALQLLHLPGRWLSANVPGAHSCMHVHAQQGDEIDDNQTAVSGVLWKGNMTVQNTRHAHAKHHEHKHTAV